METITIIISLEAISGTASLLGELQILRLGLSSGLAEN